MRLTHKLANGDLQLNKVERYATLFTFVTMSSKSSNHKRSIIKGLKVYNKTNCNKSWLIYELLKIVNV